MKAMKQFLFAFLLLFSFSAHSEIQVEIIGGNEAELPIAIFDFKQEPVEVLEHDIAQIIRSDLVRSGYFNDSYTSLNTPKTLNNKPNYQFYRLLDIENILTGKIVKKTTTTYEVEVTLHDSLRKKPLWTRTWQASPKQFRQIAHIISNFIFEEIIGISGDFTNQLAYVLVEKNAAGKNIYKLQVSDSDGFNEKTILVSDRPILSPAWSPDARSIAYVSFENHHSEIFVQSVYTGKRKLVASYKGINSAPSWAPNGRQIVFTSSQQGNPELFLLTLETKRLRRLTYHTRIDTEATFSRDGKHIYFTSDRSGSPQIYRLDVRNLKTKRITSEGRYNAKPSINGEGDRLVFIHGESGQFDVVIFDLESNTLTPISNTFLDESPSFSPSGQLIAYASVNRINGRGELVLMSTNGKSKHVLSSSKGTVRDPTWSPKINP